MALTFCINCSRITDIFIQNPPHFRGSKLIGQILLQSITAWSLELMDITKYWWSAWWSARPLLQNLQLQLVFQSFCIVFCNRKTCSIDQDHVIALAIEECAISIHLRNSWLALGPYSFALWRTVWSVLQHLTEFEHRIIYSSIVSLLFHLAASVTCYIISKHEWPDSAISHIHAQTITLPLPCLTHNVAYCYRLWAISVFLPIFARFRYNLMLVSFVFIVDFDSEMSASLSVVWTHFFLTKKELSTLARLYFFLWLCKISDSIMGLF